MAKNDQEIKDLKRRSKQMRNQRKMRTNLRRLDELDDPLPVIERIENDIKSLDKHLKILKRVLKK